MGYYYLIVLSFKIYKQNTSSQFFFFFATSWQVLTNYGQVIKSIPGYITLNEYQDIQTIISIINNHRYFFGLLYRFWWAFESFKLMIADVLNYKVKLGKDCDRFSSQTLMVDLKIFDQVLKDQTIWGDAGYLSTQKIRLYFLKRTKNLLVFMFYYISWWLKYLEMFI